MIEYTMTSTLSLFIRLYHYMYVCAYPFFEGGGGGGGGGLHGMVYRIVSIYFP